MSWRRSSVGLRGLEVVLFGDELKLLCVTCL